MPGCPSPCVPLRPEWISGSAWLLRPFHLTVMTVFSPRPAPQSGRLSTSCCIIHTSQNALLCTALLSYYVIIMFPLPESPKVQRTSKHLDGQIKTPERPIRWWALFYGVENNTSYIFYVASPSNSTYFGVARNNSLCHDGHRQGHTQKLMSVVTPHRSGMLWAPSIQQ